MQGSDNKRDRSERLAWRLMLAILCITLGMLLMANPMRLRDRLEAGARESGTELGIVMRQVAEQVDWENPPDPTAPAEREMGGLIGVLARYLDVTLWLGEATPTATPTAKPTGQSPAHQPPTPTPTPLILCSVTPLLLQVQDNGDGTYTAVFSYENPNSSCVNIPVGSQNAFSPEPADRGQVTTFHPTNKLSAPPRAFAVVFREKSLTWTLMGRSVTAAVYE